MSDCEIKMSDYLRSLKDKQCDLIADAIDHQVERLAKLKSEKRLLLGRLKRHEPELFDDVNDLVNNILKG